MRLNHRCPRRDEAFDRSPLLRDTWITRDGDETCSYCGSLSVIQFLRYIENGVEVVPTDKNYKVYLKTSHFTKFYFQHLSKEDRIRFIEIYNDQKLKISYPGYFYVTPYFCEEIDPS